MRDLEARLDDLRATVDLTEVFDDIESLMSCCAEQVAAFE